MILAKPVLVRCKNSFMGSSSGFFSSCVLADLRLFLVWCMWPLDVAIDWGIFLLISLLVKLDHVANQTLLIAWMRVCLTGLTSMAWYHCASSVLVLSVINVFADYCVGVGLGCGGISLTFHMPAAPLQVPSMNTSTCFCTINKGQNIPHLPPPPIRVNNIHRATMWW